VLQPPLRRLVTRRCGVGIGKQLVPRLLNRTKLHFRLNARHLKLLLDKVAPHVNRCGLHTLSDTTAAASTESRLLLLNLPRKRSIMQHLSRLMRRRCVA
jgi:hypothetical protein